MENRAGLGKIGLGHGQFILRLLVILAARHVFRHKRFRPRQPLPGMRQRAFGPRHACLRSFEIGLKQVRVDLKQHLPGPNLDPSFDKPLLDDAGDLRPYLDPPIGRHTSGKRINQDDALRLKHHGGDPCRPSSIGRQLFRLRSHLVMENHKQCEGGDAKDSGDR